MMNPHKLLMELELDKLEAAAIRAYQQVYGPPRDDVERLFVQRGIDAMRLAVAKAITNSETGNE